MKNKNSGYGLAMMMQIAASVGPTFGRILVVSEDSDPQIQNDSLSELFDPDDVGKVRFYRTLEAAYDAATSNANDVILLSAHTTHALADGIAWSKNRIHVIGMDGGDRLVQQGSKVELSGAVDSAYVIKVTGVRNSFRNIKFLQSSTHANALHVLEEGGEGNLYKNCTFTFGVVNNLDLTTATEVLCGSDSATYDSCLFGTETLLTSAARTVFSIDQVTTNQEFKSNQFKNCTWLISSSDASALLLKVIATTDVLFSNLFRDSVFLASLDSAGGIALTNAASSVGSLVKGCLAFAGLHTFNCTNFMTTSDQVEVSAPASSANGHEAQVPS